MMTPYFTVMACASERLDRKVLSWSGYGRAVIAPFAVTAIAPQALALLMASASKA